MHTMNPSLNHASPMLHRAAVTPSMLDQSGFTLIEVLVAIMVLSLGLLGLAGLQATSLQANHSAYLRSQASVLSYDIIDAMRANREAARAGQYDVALAAASPTGTTIPAQDIRRWRANLAAALPDGKGAIATVVGADGGVTLTITLRWDDSRAGGSASQQMISNSQL